MPKTLAAAPSPNCPTTRADDWSAVPKPNPAAFVPGHVPAFYLRPPHTKPHRDCPCMQQN